MIAFVCLRRRKTDMLDGKPILSLPPRTHITTYVQLSPPEQKLYDTVSCILWLNLIVCLVDVIFCPFAVDSW
jgi:hypothetical protein